MSIRRRRPPAPQVRRTRETLFVEIVLAHARRSLADAVDLAIAHLRSPVVLTRAANAIASVSDDEQSQDAGMRTVVVYETFARRWPQLDLEAAQAWFGSLAPVEGRDQALGILSSRKEAFLKP